MYEVVQAERKEEAWWLRIGTLWHFPQYEQDTAFFNCSCCPAYFDMQWHNQVQEACCDILDPWTKHTQHPTKTHFFINLRRLNNTYLRGLECLC